MSGREVLLSSGHHMPLLGLGCWQSPADEVAAAVEVALEAGYRHIDTAFLYLNEDSVGAGLHRYLEKSGTPRDKVFVVTKLPLHGMYAGGVEKFLKKSLEALKLSYVDLYLIHLPVGVKGAHDMDTMPKTQDGMIIIDCSTDLIALWKEMEHMVDKGLTKSIGVSNFSVKQIRKLCAISRIQPAVQQVELHVHFQQREMQEFCRAQNIVVTAYGPLGSPGRQVEKGMDTLPRLLDDPVVRLVAERHGVSTAQVLIRFLIQQGIVAIPKSTNPQRIKVNGEVWSFTLSEMEMAALTSLDKGESGRSFTFANFPGMSEHPEFPLPLSS
ncbi:1,5-anhydro-D-fructose reductase [Procambarus clarkii]|uniref:1,5-anhydro-D-fructose reductase n=1 Tax=Procambarus clarkii TaxID=6728 RepID=UPI001E6720D1|nr:1,5-anhydro-D-fructose reductase-like [Procambarus clarkii]